MAERVDELASLVTPEGVVQRLELGRAPGTPPFDDQETMIATLLHIWTSALYPS